MYYRALVLCCCMLAIYEIECAEKHLQNLEPQPGYIPVYIRPGDTPLEDINMDLAEAFRSYAYRHYKINSARVKAKNIPDTKEKSNFIIEEEKNNIPVITLYEDDYNRPRKITE